MRMTLLIMVCDPVSFGLSLSAVHACPTGVPSRPTLSATGQNLRKGTPACLGQGIRTCRGAQRNLGRRACVRRAEVL
jgi:hypothetical protein